MFTQQQIEQLNQPLEQSRIKSREKGNISLSYIEGHDAIERANFIFGYGNWSYTISKLELVSHEINQNQNNVISYKAIVNVTLHNDTNTLSREDVGFGSGIAKTLSDAHEGAGKEAVTDALKRALKSFGNQFGLSLYNKDKNQTTTNQQNYQQPSQNQTTYQPTQQPYKHQQDFRQLTNLGLQVVTQDDLLIVTGDTMTHKNTIKSLGFRWDGQSKNWYMQLRNVA